MFAKLSVDARKQDVPSAGKYPHLGSSYQIGGVPGLYFAGALAHARDYRRSAGGFIHGFRYTVRALHRILRRSDGMDWPNMSYALDATKGCARLMHHVWRRIGEAAGPYQMFGELVDVVLFEQRSSRVVGYYLEELPLAYLHEEYGQTPRLVVRFIYGRRFSPLDLPSPGAVGSEFAEFSAFLHPRLELFPGSGSNERPVLSHALVEDVFTEWQAQVGHVDPLLRFLGVAIERVVASLGASSAEVARAAAEKAAAEAGGWTLGPGTTTVALPEAADVA